MARLSEQHGSLPHRVVRGKGLEGLASPDDSAFAEFRSRFAGPGGLDDDGLRASCSAT